MQIDADRLARVLGMLGSEHDGEVVAAARAAGRILSEGGVTWREFAARGCSVPTASREPPRGYQEAPKAQRPPPGRRDYGQRKAQPRAEGWSKTHRGVAAGDLVRWLRANRLHRLTDWEKAFTLSLQMRNAAPSLSEKEWAKLWEVGLREGAIVEDVA